MTAVSECILSVSQLLPDAPQESFVVRAVGHIAVGMNRQGFDLQLTQYDGRGWRATFYTTGAAWERTLWRATQRAAWEALNVESARPA